MNKITKNTICLNSKIKKEIFIIQYRILQQINQIFEILGLRCFAFTALAIEKTSTPRNFFTKQDWNRVIVVSDKNLKTNEAENSWNLKNSEFQSKIYWLLKRSEIDMEMCANS